MSKGNGMTKELYKVHRPSRFSELKGQDKTVNSLVTLGKKGKIPHCMLLTGPSGCGKTTTARILCRVLNCGDMDLEELNCAGDARGIDTVREIADKMWLNPIDGDVRVWIMDEFQKTTSDAQSAFLKILEDTPPHCYFILCTTEPEKVTKTIRTRATEFKFSLLKDEALAQLVKEVAGKESFELSSDVLESILGAAEGSPRKALVLLDQIQNIQGEQDQLAAISSGISSTKAIDLARAIFKPGVQWKELAIIIKELDDDPEAVRRLILGYAQTILLGGGKLSERAFSVIDVFRDPLFNVGKPGLTANCFDCLR